MIVSASGRTDVSTFYFDWFFKSDEGGICPRSKPNEPKASQPRPLTPDVVDCVVFWTKDAAHALEGLDQIKIPYCFQYALNPYGSDLEQFVPSKRDTGIETFIRLSEKIGSKRVAWRYNPVVVNDKYGEAYHIKYFGELAKRLSGYAGRCVIGFFETKTKKAALRRGCHIARQGNPG